MSNYPFPAEMPDLMYPGVKPVGKIKGDRENPLTNGLLLSMPLQMQHTSTVLVPELASGYNFRLYNNETLPLPDGVECAITESSIVKTMPDSEYGNMFTNDFTMTFLWKNLITTSKYRFMAHHTAYTSFSMSYESDGRDAWFTGQKISGGSDTSVILDGKVHLMMYVYTSNGTIRLYIDGIYSGTATKAVTGLTGTFSINGRSDLAQRQSGGILHAFNMFDYAIKEENVGNISRELTSNPYGLYIPA